LYKTASAHINSPARFREEGATPITKNVIVTDESGKEYEATYPKRAKGLVKNGRARFIDSTHIVLACPPDFQLTEDITMSENTTNATNATNTAANPTAAAFTPEEILKRIDAIIADNAHINKALDSLSGSDGSGGYSVGSAPHSIAAIVENRETTNQQLIGLLAKMFESTQSPKPERGFMDSQVISGLIEPIEDEDIKADLIKEYLRLVFGNSAAPPVSVHNHYNGDGDSAKASIFGDSFPFGNWKGAWKNGKQPNDGKSDDDE
jgi:hypothetical protein